MKKIFIVAFLIVATTAFGQFRYYSWGTQRAVILK